MNISNSSFIAAMTPDDLSRQIECANLSETRRRDLVSAVLRICIMGGASRSHFLLTPDSVRILIAAIKPAAHGISGKTFANIQSSLRAALALAGIIDAKINVSRLTAEWLPLIKSMAYDKSLAFGLGQFVSFCATKGIVPGAVDDEAVALFRDWLRVRTIARDPDGRARSIPRFWNSARLSVANWPDTELALITDGLKPRKIAWDELPASFRNDAEKYLEARRSPDLFDDEHEAPIRPLAKSTLHQQREHIRLSFGVLKNAGSAPGSLAELVEPERVKAILRHYHERAEGRPNAFAVGVSKTLKAIAKCFVHVGADQMAKLRNLMARLPDVPFDLTEKNKHMLQQFDDRAIAGLFALPETLMTEARHRLESETRNYFGPAQSALAIAILLVAPMRGQNLIGLNWRRHFREPKGKRGGITLMIPASETKTRRSDLAFILDAETSDLIRWYRRVILPALGADADGDLFVLAGGKRRGLQSVCKGVTVAIESEIGIHMTAHQFRHLAAKLYLDMHPEDFETVRQLLGHSFGKTTLIYAGLSSERASKAYGGIVIKQRERLRLIATKRSRKRPADR